MKSSPSPRGRWSEEERVPKAAACDTLDAPWLSPDHAWAPEKHSGGNIHFGPEGIVAQESPQIEDGQLRSAERQTAD